jgi:hypothetical protein
MAPAEPRLCRLCHERHVPPARVRARDYRCTRCIQRSAAVTPARARYNAGAKRRAVVQRANQRRIYIGRTYHSTAPSAAEAQRINDHIKEKRREFVEGFSHREKAQGPTSR